MTNSPITLRKDFAITIYGFSGAAVPGAWAQTGIKLMNRMWEEVKSNQLPNKGLNVWIYDEDNKMFAGVELTAPPPENSPLEQRTLVLTRYAYQKHLGSYDTLGKTVAAAHEEFKKLGIKAGRPYVEIYGHHTDDPAKLETELFWSVY